MDSWPLIPSTIAAGTCIGAFLLSKYWNTTPDNIGAYSRHEQAVEIKGKPGVYKSALLQDKDVDFVENYYPEVQTLYDVFTRGVKESNNGPCLGTRDTNGSYNYISYKDVESKADALSATFVTKCGLEHGNAYIGVYSRNRPEWFISALACIHQSLVVVPLYDTLGADSAAFIINQTEMKVLIVENAKKVRELLSRKAELPTLKTIIVIDSKEDDVKSYEVVTSADSSLTVMTFEEALAYGAERPQKYHLPSKHDTYIICYTSGTTGTPKGVMLSHYNMVANLAGWSVLLENFHPQLLRSDQIHISYLPLSHMMEQMTHWSMLVVGARIGYISKSIMELMDDVAALKPTVFTVVPRLMNRICSGIRTKVDESGWLSRLVYRLAYSRKLALLQHGVITRESVWDRVVFNKIQQKLGGQIHSMATGSAPVSPEILEMCRVVFGAAIVEGYGQTECTVLVTCTWPGDWEGGHCGAPIASATVKLADVPELNYFAKEGTGELLVKGPTVTKGYFKDPEKTAELIDEEGFLHTGDVARILPNGCIKIIDRKKHIFKLAQGEYVAPEKIENVYMQCPVVQQIFVDGSSLERWLIAVVVPDAETLKNWNEEHGVKGRDMEEICSDPKAEEFVLSLLIARGKEMKLNSLEQVKKIYLTTEAFTVENDLLTPTLKAKRPQLRQKYQEVMDKIYKDNSAL
ncbi:unnamed protein product [Auanema sp. JU1783]|nr:unnamed protein product [Auanema sp. JU1783]